MTVKGAGKKRMAKKEKKQEKERKKRRMDIAHP